VSAGWVAATVRARALARRRLGAAATRRLAASGSLPVALQALAGSSFGRQAQPELELGEAQHAVAAAILWDLRVLAGWLPRGGLRLMRVLAGWFEIANTDELLAAMAGGGQGSLFRLGALGSAWPQLRRSRSPAGLRSALAASAWGDPGGDSAYDVRIGMRARWAGRAAALGQPVSTWAAGGAALLVAGERFAAGRQPPPQVLAVAAGLIGPRAAAAGTLAELAASLPAQARWALAGTDSPADLWRAEARWWARVDSDGMKLLATSGFSSEPVLGAAAVLAADAWRVRAALEIAARGGGPLEVYDAVA
jgi:hypothetical protein